MINQEEYEYNLPERCTKIEQFKNYILYIYQNLVFSNLRINIIRDKTTIYPSNADLLEENRTYYVAII